MSRVAPRIGGFAASVSVVLLLSLILNSWLGVFPAIISGVMPMKFHIHYYLGNLFGLEYASAYSESGVMTMQEHLQLIILPMALMAARMGLRQRPTFEMPSSPSLSEQAEAMEAGTVATVGQVDESGSFRICFSVNANWHISSFCFEQHVRITTWHYFQSTRHEDSSNLCIISSNW